MVLRSLTTTEAVAHELIPVAGGIGTGSRKVIGWGGMGRAPRRPFNETSEKEIVGDWR